MFNLFNQAPQGNPNDEGLMAAFNDKSKVDPEIAKMGISIQPGTQLPQSKYANDPQPQAKPREVTDMGRSGISIESF